MLILEAEDVEADVVRLNMRWEGPATFAYVSDRRLVPPSLLEKTLHSLPKALDTRHFALLTSGSTGRPKLIIGSRERAEALARLLHECQDGEDVEETILALPLTYCYAFVNQWLWARVKARRLVPTDGLGSPARLKQVLARTHRAMLCLVGAQASLVIEHFGSEVFPGVIRLHFAGGLFPQRALGELSRIFPNARIFNNYGCAEAMPRLCLRPANGSSVPSNVGRPLPGVELKIDAAGELLFRSPYAAVGHLDEEGFHATDPVSWIHTGDLAKSVADGSWELTGRATEVFKRYGEKIALPALLAAVEGVWRGEAAFFREVDARGEDGYVLVVGPPPAPEELRRLLRLFRSFPSRSHWPLRVEASASLPRLPNGKPDVLSIAVLPETHVLWRQRL